PEDSLKFIGKSPLPVLDWALLSRICENKFDDGAKLQPDLIQACQKLTGYPGLEYSARYEVATAVYKSGKRDEGRQLFPKLFLDTAATGLAPPIDPTFCSAMTTDGRTLAFADLVRQAAATFVSAGQRSEVFALAWQAEKLGEREIANELMAQAIT